MTNLLQTEKFIEDHRRIVSATWKVANASHEYRGRLIVQRCLSLYIASRYLLLFVVHNRHLLINPHFTLHVISQTNLSFEFFFVQQNPTLDHKTLIANPPYIAVSTRFLVLFLSFLSINAVLGEFICENLPNDVCAFSVSLAGKRCLLETMSKKDGSIEYQCRTSEVVVEGVAEYIETDQCVQACGIDRKSVGISSDTLLEPQFMAKLCSAPCYQKCPNIADLYFNLAAGEGVFLPDLCDKQRSNPHRAMIALMSSGEAAPSPYGSQVPSGLSVAYPPSEEESLPPSEAFEPAATPSPM